MSGQRHDTPRQELSFIVWGELNRAESLLGPAGHLKKFPNTKITDSGNVRWSFMLRSPSYADQTKLRTIFHAQLMILDDIFEQLLDLYPDIVNASKITLPMRKSTDEVWEPDQILIVTPNIYQRATSHADTSKASPSKTMPDRMSKRKIDVANDDFGASQIE